MLFISTKLDDKLHKVQIYKKKLRNNLLKVYKVSKKFLYEKLDDVNLLIKGILLIGVHKGACT